MNKKDDDNSEGKDFLGKKESFKKPKLSTTDNNPKTGKDHSGGDVDHAQLESKKYSTTDFLRDSLIIVTVGLLIAFLIQGFLVKPYLIPSESMTPTLQIGDRILVDKTAYLRSEPKTNDVVVFHPPKNIEGPNPCAAERILESQVCPQEYSQPDSVTYIKRIVAQPGDRIAIKNGFPVVNGQLVLPEGYNIVPCVVGGKGCNYPEPIVIPKDHYFVMGDNRGGSLDSRFWGPLPKKWLIGRAFTTYWPLNQINGL